MQVTQSLKRTTVRPNVFMRFDDLCHMAGNRCGKDDISIPYI